MTQLSLNEIHQTLLGIAKEFDRICTKHKIPYYMLGGTMLGAIRHKGFIPWDDDMDFGVPVERYEELQRVLKDELCDTYKCSTYKNSKSIFLPFIKVEDTTTILDDEQNPLPIKEKIGVNIDVFPLYNTSEPELNFTKSIRFIELGAKIYTNSRKKSKMISYIKRILRTLCPLKMHWFIEKSIKYASKIPTGSYLSNVWGRWGEREFIPTEWYGEWERYDFENLSLCGLKNYDAYLTKMYKEYMTLPKESDRFAHSEMAYKR